MMRMPTTTGVLRKIALGHPEAAISDYDKAIQLNPKLRGGLLQSR